jgi:hypothetical protein
MRTSWRRWTAILMLILLPLPSVAMAVAGSSTPAECMPSVEAEACCKDGGKHTDDVVCSMLSNDSGTAPAGYSHCSQCSGLGGASFALSPSPGGFAAVKAGFVAIAARPAHLPSPPPSRLERPPRAFSS